MDKIKTLESVINAKKAHESQMQKIDTAIEGGVVANPTSISHTECDFGQWLYNEDTNLRKILGALFYDKLELLHTQWHGEYAKVFEILFNKEEKKGFFAKFTKDVQISEMDMDRVKIYYSELASTTKELIQTIDASHRRLRALQESKFE